MAPPGAVFQAMHDMAFFRIRLFLPQDQLARIKRDVLYLEAALGGAQALTFCR